MNNATGLYHCFGCDVSGDIFTFYARLNGLDTRSDFPRITHEIGQTFGIPDGSRHEKPAVVARYNYRDADDNLTYQIERFEPKTFKARRPDGNGGWLYNTGEVKIIPYRLPELSKADAVVVVEGEER